MRIPKIFRMGLVQIDAVILILGTVLFRLLGLVLGGVIVSAFHIIIAVTCNINNVNSEYRRWLWADDE